MPRGPEDQARDRIYEMLCQAGWSVQNHQRYDPGVPECGLAIREYPFESGEEVFEYSPFEEKGGTYRAYDLFDRDDLNAILDELNEVVTA